MSSPTNITKGFELLGRLSRHVRREQSDRSVVASPGAGARAWAVKVKSLSSYNVYNVRMVVIGNPGAAPVEIGDEMKAANLAEPFAQQGQLQAGTHVVMSRVGQKNVFYAPV